MREFEVRYATKTAGPAGHHEKVVTEIGGTNWRMKRDAAIGWIQADAHTFYIKRGEERVYLMVGARDGQSWLRSAKDWDQANLLLDLPDCPAEMEA